MGGGGGCCMCQRRGQMDHSGVGEGLRDRGWNDSGQKA